MITLEDRQQRTSALAALLRPIHGSPNYGRLQAFIKVQTSGKTLTDYLGSEATEEDKIALIARVEDIITGNKWDECPTAPNGQADAPAPAPARPMAPPAAAPKVVIPVGAPAPKPVTPQLPPPLPASAYVPTAEVALDPMTALMVKTLLPHVVAAMPKTAVDADTIRQIVRDELAVCFAAMAKGVQS